MNLTDFNFMVFFSKHSLERMKARSISEEIVNLILIHSDLKSHVGSFQRRYQISKKKILKLKQKSLINLEDSERLSGIYVICSFKFVDPILKVNVITTAHMYEAISKTDARVTVLRKTKSKKNRDAKCSFKWK